LAADAGGFNAVAAIEDQAARRTQVLPAAFDLSFFVDFYCHPHQLVIEEVLLKSPKPAASSNQPIQRLHPVYTGGLGGRLCMMLRIFNRK
jgi:hypothetical protein